MSCFRRSAASTLFQGLFYGILFSSSVQCAAQKKQGRYDLSNPKIITLSKEVDQVSGISWQAGNFVYAVDDDHGAIYKITLDGDPVVTKWAFGQKEDFEDLVLVNNTFYVLNSNGDIVAMPASFPLQKSQRYAIGAPGNEFETLYYDPSLQKLVLLCKRCGDDSKKETTAWAFNLQTKKFDAAPLYEISKKNIEQVLGTAIARFKPSAAAIQPGTGYLYVLASVNKLLVVLNKGKVIEVLPLDEKIFKQPEGLSFTANGDLLISNEDAKQGAANILFFKKT